MNKTLCLVLKVVAAVLAVAAVVFLVVRFRDKIAAAFKGIGGKSEYEDYADEDLFD